MKLSQIQQEIAKDEEAVSVPLHDKAGEPYLASDGSPVTFRVLGSDARVLRHVKEQQQRRFLRQRKPVLDPADILANRIERAAAAVVDWHGMEDDAGQPLPCTREHVTQALAAAHILTQIEEAIDAHAAFFGASSPA